MSDLLKGFQQGTANWREILRRNKRRTFIVIAIFVLLYVCLGLLIDIIIYSQRYMQAPISEIFYALITFQITPFATIITAGIAVISLWVTFTFHDRLMLLGSEYHEVTGESKDTREKQVYNVVEEMKVAAGLQYMPRVYIIEAPYMNAFASGYSEKSAMVAITRGLLDKLNRAELQAVMAHELSHIRHMDIKLTLMASVLANLMIIMIDVLFWGVIFGGGRRSNREGGGGANWLFIIVMVLRYVLPLITVLLMLFLSRTREYMADAGCVELTRDNEPLAKALLKIQGDHTQNAEEYADFYNSTPHESVRREAYIFDPVKAGIGAKGSMASLFSSHPSVADRLKALGFKVKNDG